MRVLVTGAGGFVGRHLTHALAEAGHTPIGFGRNRPDWWSSAETFWLGNLLQAKDVEKAVVESNPEAVIHMAAESSVRRFWEDPATGTATNCVGSVNLLEALRRNHFTGRVISVGSSEEYGALEGSIDETACAVPSTPYGASKWFQGQVGLQFQRRYGLSVVHVRPFPHTGPGQTPTFVLSDWARQVVRERKGMAGAGLLRVGCVDLVRDYLDVSDVVGAYMALLHCDCAGMVVNVSRGEGISLRSLAEMLIEQGGGLLRLHIEASRLREGEPQTQVGRAERLMSLTGWTPKVEYSEIAHRLLEYWDHPEAM